VYLPDVANETNTVPILLWWHGGGLLQGTRKAIAPHMLEAPSKHNICVVSADYRLAPQTRMPGILADCKAAMDFLSSPEFAAATGNRVNPSKVVVSGSSAGGWLSLLCGTGIGFKACGLEPPRPVAGIAAIYPITDLLDSFWTTPQHPVSWEDRVIPRSEVETFLNPSSLKISASAVESQRAIFYTYMVQEGILGDLLLNGTNIPEQKFSVAQELKSGKYTVPPIYIIHGNNDQKVPHRQATDVVSALKAISAEVEYHELEGLDHGFDKDPSYDLASMYEFIVNALN